MRSVLARGAARDALGLGLALLALLAWEASGGDRALSAWAGGNAGFPLRQPGSRASWLHEAGRGLGALALALLLVDAAWPAPPWRAPGAARGVARRRLVAAATVATLLAVPALKRASRTSCPWDVVDYGGSVPWVSHWVLAVVDGGPGHCFPSGHAVAAFAFLVPALAARRQHPRAARAALAGVLAAGALFGGVQLLRGAHYLSHLLWSAWLCAAVAVAVDGAGRLQPGFRIGSPNRRARVPPAGPRDPLPPTSPRSPP